MRAQKHGKKSKSKLASGKSAEVIDIARSDSATNIVASSSSQFILNGKELDAHQSHDFNWPSMVFSDRFLLWIILFLRLPSICANAGIILCLTLVILVATLVMTSLQSVFLVYRHVRRLSSVYSCLKNDFGLEIASSLGIAQFAAYVLTSSIYALAASEVIQYSHKGADDDKYTFNFNLISKSMFPFESETLAIIIVCGSAILLFGFNRKIFYFTLPLFALFAIALIGCQLFAIIDFGSNTPLAQHGRSVFPELSSVREYFFLFSLLFIPFSGVNFEFDAFNISRDGSVGAVSSYQSSIVSVVSILLFVIVFMFLLCLMVPNSSLSKHSFVLGELSSLVGPFIQIAVFIICVRSSFRFLVLATELLQTIANDRIFPFLRFLAIKSVESNEDIMGPTISNISGHVAHSMSGHNLLNNTKSSMILDSAPPGVDSSDIPIEQDHIEMHHNKRLYQQVNSSFVTSNISGQSCDVELGRVEISSDSSRRSEGMSIWMLVSDTFSRAFSLRASSYTIIITAVLASIASLAGDFDYLAPIYTIFQIIIIVSLNLSYVIASLFTIPRGSQSHQSRFVFVLAILTIIISIVVSFLVSWWITLIIYSVMIFVILLAHRTTATKDWGDLLYGFMFQLSRNILLEIDPRNSKDSLQKSISKNWRPQILTIVPFMETSREDASTLFGLSLDSQYLIRFVGQMRMGKGLTLVTGCLSGDITQQNYANQAQSAKDYLYDYLVTEKINGFVNVVVAQNANMASQTAIQVQGIGPLTPNAVMLQWPADWTSLSMGALDDMSTLYKSIIAVKKTLLLMKGSTALPGPRTPKFAHGFIDIWWVVHDGGLLLLLPHLLTLHETWMNCRLRLFVVMTRPEDNPVKFERRAARFLQKVNIQADVEVVDVSSIGDAASVYAQTMDINTRMMLLRSLQINPTMTLALQSDTVWQGRQEKRTHVADIFNLPRNNPKDESSNVNNSPMSIFKPEVTNSRERMDSESDDNNDATASYYKYNSSKTKTAATRITATALATASIPLSEDMTTAKHLDIGLREEAKRVAQSFRVDANRIYVALALNQQMRSKSKGARLIVSNLPLVRTTTTMSVMSYVDCLTKDIEPVLLVRGSGREVITTYE